MENLNLEIARRYLAAIEQGTELTPFYHPRVIQEEFPNRLNPSGSHADLDGILAAYERGRKVLLGQRFEILNTIAQGEEVAIEVQWTGTLAVAFGKIPEGGQMRARFTVWLTFDNGRILSQRNYDCFEPF